MCGGVDGCQHGQCVANGTGDAALQVCLCDSYYRNSICSNRYRLWYTELPLTGVLLLGWCLLGLRINDQALELLVFPENPVNEFVFPRKLICFLPKHSRYYELVHGFFGKWKGPTKRKRFRTLNWQTTLCALIAAVCEMITWLQMTAICFLPLFPWPEAARSMAQPLRLLLFHWYWQHQKIEATNSMHFYFAVAAMPVALIVACALGWKRFPLFKPQPKSSPSEDLCSLALRCYSDWLFLPFMIVLMQPLECIFVGYEEQGYWFHLAVPSAACYNSWQSAIPVVVSFAACCSYWYISCAIVFQLTCEASPPLPTFWSDLRYMRAVQVTKSLLALSVVSLMNANPMVLSALIMGVAVFLAFLNVWMRPSLYILINLVRFCGAIIALWTSVIALVTSLRDDPSSTILFEIWQQGMAALVAVTLSAALVHQGAEFVSWRKTPSQAVMDLATKAHQQQKIPSTASTISLISDMNSTKSDE